MSTNAISALTELDVEILKIARCNSVGAFSAIMVGNFT
jgi:hypothetical protein